MSRPLQFVVLSFAMFSLGFLVSYASVSSSVLPTINEKTYTITVVTDENHVASSLLGRADTDPVWKFTFDDEADTRAAVDASVAVLLNHQSKALGITP